MKKEPLLQWAVKRYTRLRMHPGWSDYALHQVQAMAKEFPWLYGKLPELVQAEVEKLQTAQRAEKERKVAA